MHTVKFYPSEQTASVPSGTSLLDASRAAGIELNTACGGEGICGKCVMIILDGEIRDRVSWPFTEEQMRNGYVLACLSHVHSDIVVEIPGATKTDGGDVPGVEQVAESDQLITKDLDYTTLPVVMKIYIEFEPPTIFSGEADHQMVSSAIKDKLNIPTLQMGLKIIGILPRVLRNNDYKVTLTVGLRRDIAEIMNIEGGNSETLNYMVIVDMGTTTLVAHLVNAHPRTTIDYAACYNSQSMHGSEVTARMIFTERRGIEAMQTLLVEDINNLIQTLCERNKVNVNDICAVVCAGNTAMVHFLLGLETNNIRREPFIPVTIEPPPLRAAEVGLRVNNRGLLYTLPGISGWVGGDLTAGILSTQMHRKDDLSVLIDIGTNGEVILGNKEWLISASASAGPALEGASVACGMRAEAGAVDGVEAHDGEITYSTIGDVPAAGICGSGIIDLVRVLLDEGIINRSGIFVDTDRTEEERESDRRRFVLVDGTKPGESRVFITEKDISNIITAKAAIFAAINILMQRTSLTYSDLDVLYIAGAFGRHINPESAIKIGLLPPVPEEKVQFIGNSSLKGAKLAAFYQEAFYELSQISAVTTYYDLLGADDYVEEFKKAMFLPHTDIDYWRAIS